jgi:SAM-dependent methyltransferase
MPMEVWEMVHRWEWFRRSQWLENFRDSKLRLAGSISAVLKGLGRSDGIVLDCSCGLGFQAITLRERGLRVLGADRSAFAVDRARELARDAGLDIEFFVSRWDELPTKTLQQFDAAFCDALCWLHTRGELLAALRGLRGILRPGGALIFQGAPEGATQEVCRRRLEEWWGSAPASSLSWRHTEGPITCTSISLGSLGEDYIDWHLLYLIEEQAAPRLEHLAIRESMRWDWDRLVEIVGEAGFSGLATHADAEWSPGGRPVGLNVARVG